MTTSAISPDPHQAVQTLLPWYVSGRIDAADRALVEGHLAGCDACRAELDAERRLSSAVTDLSLDAERDWLRMRSKLKPAHSDRPGRWRFVGTVVAAQAAAVMLFVGVTRWPTQPPEEYRTLSASPTVPLVAQRSALVMFRPDATERALRESLAAIDGRIVDGPTDANAYVIRFEGDAGARLAVLKRSPAVLMAEPIQ